LFSSPKNKKPEQVKKWRNTELIAPISVPVSSDDDNCWPSSYTNKRFLQNI
jgi:hypothetical protein